MGRRVLVARTCVQRGTSSPPELVLGGLWWARGGGAATPLSPLLPADIWGFDPFFFNLLLLRCI